MTEQHPCTRCGNMPGDDVDDDARCAECQMRWDHTHPKVGMGVTYGYGSDRYPATIVEVAPNGKLIRVQDDDYRVVSGHGNDGSAVYEYSPRTSGYVMELSLRKNGRWVPVGNGLNDGPRVTLGVRRAYRDPSY